MYPDAFDQKHRRVEESKREMAAEMHLRSALGRDQFAVVVVRRWKWPR